MRIGLRGSKERSGSPLKKGGQDMPPLIKKRGIPVLEYLLVRRRRLLKV